MKRSSRCPYFIFILAAFFVLFPLNFTAQAKVFRVDSAGDEEDDKIGDGICATKLGKCTLRAAIEEANQTVDLDIISIAPKKIKLTKALDPIAFPVSIAPAVTSVAASPQMVTLEGTPNIGPALILEGGDSELKFLSIIRFGGDGIRLWYKGNNIVQGCHIGTNAKGITATDGNGGSGISIYNSSSNTIGGSRKRDRNIISNNTEHGIVLWGHGLFGNDNKILGNYIGTDRTGTQDLGNDGSGIYITNVDNTEIGGTGDGLRNVICGNNSHGIFIRASSNTKVQGNYIGTDANGKENIKNNEIGIFIIATPSNTSNTIGGTSKDARNIIAANRIGIQIQDIGPPSTFASVTSAPGSNPLTIVQGNYIGVGKDVTGTVNLGNNQSGVFIVNSPYNLIGGIDKGAANLIAKNWHHGILIKGVDSEHNTVQGNYIGVVPKKNGVHVKAGNTLCGVKIDNAPNNTIGGTTEQARNIISANGRSGILIEGLDSHDNTIEGNYIGIGLGVGKKLIEMKNIRHGVSIDDAPSNTIGGIVAGAGNVISCNRRNGIYIRDPDAQSNNIQGNYIGTGPKGKKDFGNQGSGVFIMNGFDNTIGGATKQARNIISGNKVYGVKIRGNSARENDIQGNYIGTDADGTSALANKDGGVLILGNAAANTIGGLNKNEGNVIAFNNGPGVKIQHNRSISNAILHNSFFSNKELGIDLVGKRGVNANDDQDPDPGPNQLQNFPLLMIDKQARSIVDVMVEGNPGRTFIVQIFSNPSQDKSLFGEGKELIASEDIDVGADGRGTRCLNLNVGAGAILTATATDDMSMDSSEFSAVSGFIDLDIDSDNTNNPVTLAPQCDAAEDEIENDETKPGRIILANINDDDADGIADFLDGFNLGAGVEDDLNDDEEDFAPLVLEIDKSVDLSKARIQIEYNAAQPAVGAPPAGDPPGRLRIWTRQGEVLRTARDYLAPGEYQTRNLRFLNHKLNLWLEGVRHSDNAGEDYILVRLDPDGAGGVGFDMADMVRVTVVRLEIRRDVAGGAIDYVPLTDLLRRVLPGQRMNLRLESQSAGLAVADFEWTLPGHPFEDYDAGHTLAILTLLYPEDLDDQDVFFYWADSDNIAPPGDRRKIKCAVTVDGVPCAGKNFFRVIKPESMLIADQGSVRLSPAGDAVGLFPNVGQIEGMNWEGRVNIPAVFGAGEWHYVQLVQDGLYRVTAAGDRQYGNHFGEWVLDNTYPYEPPPYAPAIGSPGGHATGAVIQPEGDSPDSVLAPPDLQREGTHDHFEMFIMFRPPGTDSRYVPLRSMLWEWRYDAENGPPGIWAAPILRNLSEDMDPSVETFDHPVWTANWAPFHWDLGPISVDIVPNEVSEGDGVVAGRATVRVVDNVVADLAVALVSNAPGEIAVPAGVVIPAGNNSQNFDFTVLDDAVADGAQPVAITATAAGYTDGQDGVVVLDND